MMPALLISTSRWLEAVLQKVAQRRDAFGVGHVERMKLRGELFLGKFFDRRRSFRSRPARREHYTGAPRAASCRQISIPDAAIAAGDDDDGTATPRATAQPRCSSLKA